jgi:O-antigen/teichoic acid export membrane protein
MLPRSVILRFLSGIYLPIFANSGTAQETRSVSATWLGVLSLLAFSYSLALIILGAPTIGFVFGKIYEPSQFFISLVSLDVFARFMNNICVPTALAKGETRFILMGTLASCAATLISCASLFLFPSLLLFIGVLTVADCVATIWIAARSIVRFDFPRLLAWTTVVLPMLLLTGFAAVEAEIAGTSLPLLLFTYVIVIAGYMLFLAFIAARSGIDLHPAISRALRRFV